MEFFASLILYLSISSLLLTPSTLAEPTTTTPAGTIERTTKQQILTTIPPDTSETTLPFLTSPSGKYIAYFLRRETTPGAGGFGNDFCYIQVQDKSSGQSAWESECAPVSTANACSLVFSDNGLAVFDGSNSAWDTGAQSADNNPLESLELVDEGDMRIRDKIGELAWKASDDPRVNQRCGAPGSPGLAPALPPFAEPIGGGGNLPFGQQGGSGGASQTFGFSNNQPLVDNSPFDSGCRKGVGPWLGLGLGWALVLSGLEYGFVVYLGVW